MSTKQPPKTRGRPIALPPWWLGSAKRRTVGWSLQGLAAALTDVVKREPAWDHTTVGKFLKGKNPTHELMEAFCKLFDGLPEPTYTARSFEEADEMRRVARRYDSNPEKQSRKTELDKAREHLEKRLSDQTARLDSQDEEGSSSRRRPRGVVGSRS